MKGVHRGSPAVSLVLVLVAAPALAATETHHADRPERSGIVEPAKLAPAGPESSGTPRLIPNVFPDRSEIPAGREPALDRDDPGGPVTDVKGGDAAAFAFPLIDVRFDGPFQSGVAPPDCVLAVGGSHVVSLINVRIAMYTKGGTLAQGPFSLSSFFGIPAEFGVFDPLAIYDPFTDRFVVSVLADYGAEQDSRIYVAFSQTGDPTGAWNKYWIDADAGQPGRWADYASIGIDRLAVYFTANLFFRGGGYSNVTLYVYSKDDGYAGLPLRNTHLIDIRTQGNSSPYRTRPSTVPVAVPGDPYFLAHTDASIGDRINLWRLTGDRFASPTLTASSVPLPGLYFAPPPGREPGGGRVDSLGGNLWNVIYEGGDLWTAQAISGTEGAAAWVSRVNVGATPEVREQTYQLEVIGKDTYFPYVIPDVEDDDFAMLSAYSGPDLRPTGRYWNVDAAGTVRAAELLADGTFSNFSGRHGDYFAMQSDPTDPNRLWMIAQYMKNENFAGNSAIASVRFEDVAQPSNPPPVPDGDSVAGQPLTVAKSGGTDVTVSWDATACPPAGVHLVWYDLASVSSYAVTEETCSAGVTGSWTGAPPSGSVAVIAVSDDVATTEGSHGRDGGGLERPSQSVACGFTTKSTAGSCVP